jgi:AraC-like DNA-binding protein
MNIRFADFSLRHRLQQAAAQLREDTSAPIKEIIRPWGFTDESHFHRVFRKHFGLAPGQYRRR